MIDGETAPWPRVLKRRIVNALSDNEASTSPDAVDPRLRGRTYAIPFERVWHEALQLAGGKLPRWKVVEADDREGIIHAEATTPLLRATDDVSIRVSLDRDAQTRVDLQSRSRTGRADLGVNARRVAKFCRMLDRRLGVGG